MPVLGHEESKDSKRDQQNAETVAVKIAGSLDEVGMRQHGPRQPCSKTHPPVVHSADGQVNDDDGEHAQEWRQELGGEGQGILVRKAKHEADGCGNVGQRVSQPGGENVRDRLVSHDQVCHPVKDMRISADYEVVPRVEKVQRPNEEGQSAYGAEAKQDKLSVR